MYHAIKQHPDELQGKARAAAMFDDFLDLLRVLFYLLAFMFFLMALPFVFCHVADTWDAPAYPHSGFRPDSPAAENSLPPTEY